MALIKCPECGNDVSDMAPFCPHCGVAIANQSEPVSIEGTKEQQISTEQSKSDKKKISPKIMIILVIVVVAIIVLSVVFFQGQGNKIRLSASKNVHNDVLTDLQNEKVDIIVKGAVQWYNAYDPDGWYEISNFPPEDMTDASKFLGSTAIYGEKSENAKPAESIVAYMAVIALTSPFDGSNGTINPNEEDIDNLRALIEEAIDFYY